MAGSKTQKSKAHGQIPTRDGDADRFISRLKSEVERYELNDGTCPGLRIIVHKGGRKTWIMRFRPPGSKRPLKTTLGVWDAEGAVSYEGGLPAGSLLNAADARTLARDINRRRSDSSRDVHAERRAEKARTRAAARGEGDTFPDVLRAFLQNEEKRPRHWRDLARTLGLRFDAEGNYVEVVRDSQAWEWREKKAGSITKADCNAAVRKARKGIPGQKPRKKEERESRARRMGGALGSFFSWVARNRDDLVETNPMLGANRGEKGKSRLRQLSRDELVALWRAASRMDYPFGSVLKLLLLTGCRREEINRLEWRELGNALDRIELPGERTKNRLPHVVYLSQQARAVIEAAPRFDRCPYVFSSSGRGYPKGWVKAKRRLDRLVKEENGGTALPPFVIHDIRRTFVTMLGEELGVLPHVVETMINHVSGFRAGVAGTYNKAQYAAERIEATNRWGAFVEELVTPPPATGANVVSIKRGKRRAA